MDDMTPPGLKGPSSKRRASRRSRSPVLDRLCLSAFKTHLTSSHVGVRPIRWRFPHWHEGMLCGNNRVLSAAESLLLYSYGS